MTPTFRKHKRKYLILIATAIVLSTIGGITAYSIVYGSITDRNSVVYIPADTSLDALMDTLSSHNSISHIRRFRSTASAMGLDKAIRPGRYELHKGMSAKQIAAMLRIGNQTPTNVTFNNIRTLPRLAAILGKQLMADSTEFAKVLLSDSVAIKYGFKPEEFIGMFIPNTYEFYWTVTPADFVARMHKEYNRFWNENRLSKLARTGLTQKEVSILASIIDEETNHTGEMPVIAGVYINRLRRNMPLQADPTVKFAVGDFSLKRILYKHLHVNSPYNTYRNTGLPPGPIRMPSIAAINAVLNYSDNNYLYFCASPDLSGFHIFASTYGEHLRNARRYAEALDKLGIK